MVSGNRIFEIDENMSISLDNIQQRMGAATGAIALGRSIRLVDALTMFLGESHVATVYNNRGESIKLLW